MYCCYKPLGVQGKFEFIDLIIRNTDFPIHMLVCYVDYLRFFSLPKDKIL